MARNTRNVCLTIPPAIIEKVDRAAAADQRTRSQFVSRVLERAITIADSQPLARAAARGCQK
jgi:uncharacterized protein (DUF1778 family)